MRVLYFSRDYGPHDHRFLAALAQTNHEVFYLRLEANQRQVEDRPVPSEIRQIRWPADSRRFRWRDLPRLRAGLQRVLADVRPDLLHAGPVQTCAFLSALAGFRPLLTMSWGFDLMQDVDRNAWWSWVTRYTLRRSTYFVSDAQVTRNKAVAYGMKPDCTAVFPWGVDLDHFKPLKGAARVAADKKLPRGTRKGSRPDAPFTVFCNRSWEPRYGVDVLARAFVRVARERPAARLILLGGGSMAQPIRQILTQGSVLDRTQFPGQVSQTDLPRWYRMANLYVSPSHVDGSSVSLMEALACGLPALVSDIPANREWVTDDVNGWLFPDGDADALAGRILHAMDRRAELPVIGRAARRYAQQHADWSKNFTVLLDAYQQAIQAVR